ncbi:MAG TPA: hypothetical protein VGD81_20095 [Opitutaceae bacterium]
MCSFLSSAMNAMRYALVITCLALSGCLSLKYDESKATLITQQGQASVRGSQEKVQAKFVGPRVVRYLVISVDKPWAAAKRANEIMPLEPGERSVMGTAHIQIPRFGGYDLYLLSAKLSFTAEAGRHYELRGRGDEHQVVLGIYELSEGKLVSKEFVGTPSLSVAERAPLFIYIP